MFVPCPHCDFLVALIVDADDGQQRCPRCGRSLDEESGATEPSPPTGPAVQPEADPGAKPSAANGTTRRGARRAPSFARMRAAPDGRPRRRWPLWLAAGGLAALLGLQLLVSQREQLAADAGWRPLVSAVCSMLGCTLPAWHEPAAWTMLSRDVAPVATEPGVLEVTAAFRNQARWPQRPPVIMLSLTDRHGRTVAARAFTPDEYQGDTMDPGLPLNSGEAMQVSFRIHEPEAEIVAFSFAFR